MELLKKFDAQNYKDTTSVFEKYTIRGIIVRDGKIAMQCSSDGEYKIPGGGMEAGETYVEALAREVKEETGLFIIPEKAVELGATEIVPVEMKRCVVKLDRKKAEKKAERWQTIALGAAKQSKRMQIPTVHMPVTFQQALAMMAESDVRLMPYENAEGMEGTRRILESIEPGESIAILIGPEGGIDEAEVEMAMKEKVEPITLGKRILRTETAGMTVLSILVYLLEGRERTR